VEEAFVNAVDHFSAVVANGDCVMLSFHLLGDELTVSVREKGIPFAQTGGEKTPAGSSSTSVAEDDLAAFEKVGLGTSLMRSVMDSVEFLSHGRDGKQVLMKKRLQSLALAPEMAEYLSPKTGRQKRRTAVNPTIRRTTPDDAVEITRAAWRTYGYTHSALLYDAEKLRQSIESGALVSFIAKSEDSDDVIFHCGLEYHMPGSKVPEGGLLFADPTWRCSGLIQRVAESTYAYSRDAGDDGLFDCCVTTHTYSQQGSQDQGSRPCCLMVGIAPAGSVTKLPGTSRQIKGSTLNHYIAFNRSEKTVYVPPKHEKIASEIYSWLDLPRTINTDTSVIAEEKGDVFFLRLPEELNVVFLIVNVIGKDTIGEIAKYQKQCVREKQDACYIFLPMGMAESPRFVEEAEALGFSFCGVMPHIHNGDDRMILQYVMLDVDMDQIRVHSDQGRRLKDYVATQLK